MMDKAALKKKIVEAIKLEKEKLEDLKEVTKPIAPENAIGRVSRMDAINNKGVNDMAKRQSEFKLSKLQNALVKINQEGFGSCTQCGNCIQEARQMLMPEVSLCIQCAS